MSTVPVVESTPFWSCAGRQPKRFIALSIPGTVLTLRILDEQGLELVTWVLLPLHPRLGSSQAGFLALFNLWVYTMGSCGQNSCQSAGGTQSLRPATAPTLDRALRDAVGLGYESLIAAE